MFFIRRRRPKTRSQAIKPPGQTTPPVNSNSDNITLCVRTSQVNIASHISKYIGKTVTVFVEGGGASGFGFTGVLMSVSDIYVKLLTRTAKAPAYPLTCFCSRFCLSSLYCRCPANNIFTAKYRSFYPGAITYIPIEKMTAFVHNSL